MHPDDMQDGVPSACQASDLDTRSCAAAMWSLAVFGGPLLFEMEMDALLEVLLPFFIALATIGEHRKQESLVLTQSNCACTGHFI